MRRRPIRAVAAVGAAALTLSFVSALPATASSKPSKAKAACTQALLQANQAIGHLDDLGKVLLAEQKALTDYAASTRDAPAGQKLFTDTQGVAAGALPVVSQVQGAANAYATARTACQKALGIKDADVTPTTTPTTTLSK